jgi:hypothetical protein
MMLVRLQLCIVLSLLLACASGASASDGGRPRLVQSLDVQIPVPPTPFVSAGKRRLAYELHLTNFTTHDVALTRVQIVDAERAQPLAEYRDLALAARLGRPGLKSEDAEARLLAGGMRAVLFLWIDLDDRAPTPGRLRHQIDLEIMRPAGRESVSLQAGDVGVGKQAPVALSAPLRGGPWVALYDPSMKFGHRTSLYTVDGRARIPARFAIDWVRLEHDATHARGDDAAAANWYGYGADVLAVADGVVAQAQDDLPALDAVSASKGPMPLENASERGQRIGHPVDDPCRHPVLVRMHQPFPVRHAFGRDELGRQHAEIAQHLALEVDLDAGLVERRQDRGAGIALPQIPGGDRR